MPPVETSTETQMILTEIAELKTDIKTIDTAIRGNGKDGIMVDIACLKQFRKFVCWIGASLFTGVLLVLVVRLLI